MIIAIKENDKVVFGYTNRQSMANFSIKDYIDDENVPMGVLENGNVFAFAVMNRMSDMFLYDETFLKMKPTPKTMVREIIPYIKNKLKENGCINNDGEWKNAIIISDGDKIYGIDTELKFYEAYDYSIHSFTNQQAEGCLEETSELPAEKRIIRTLSFLGDLYGEDLFPLVIMDTKSRKKKYVYEGESIDEYGFGV